MSSNVFGSVIFLRNTKHLDTWHILTVKPSDALINSFFDQHIAAASTQDSYYEEQQGFLFLVKVVNTLITFCFLVAFLVLYARCVLLKQSSHFNWDQNSMNLRFEKCNLWNVNRRNQKINQELFRKVKSKLIFEVASK